MKISATRSFSSREDLDSYIRSTHGDNAEANKDVVLELSAEEMKHLSLSEDVTVFGVRIKTGSEEAIPTIVDRTIAEAPSPDEDIDQPVKKAKKKATKSK